MVGDSSPDKHRHVRPDVQTVHECVQSVKEKDLAEEIDRIYVLSLWIVRVATEVSCQSIQKSCEKLRQCTPVLRVIGYKLRYHVGKQHQKARKGHQAFSRLCSRHFFEHVFFPFLAYVVNEACLIQYDKPLA